MKPVDLIQSLTLEQKLAQLIALGDPQHLVKDKKFDKEKAQREYPNGIFGLMVPIDLTPPEIGEWVSEMWECFLELSPVPPLLMCESLHGIIGKDSTVFPQSIGMGASFDSNLMYRIGEAIGREAKAMGIRMSLAPDLDLGREPRWGRIEETYGESPFLVGKMGEAYVKGLLADDGKYAAVLKHFVAHGSPESGINLAPTYATDQEMEDRYLPPFKRALDAGAKGIMPAYSALNGIPCHAHPKLMNTVLREEWGFDGVVVSDFGGVDMLIDFMKTAENAEEAQLLAMSCGIDVQVPGVLDIQGIKKLIKDGRLYVETVDKAVLRILKLKTELGLFDLPKPDKEEIQRTVNCDAHKALAREAAQKSMVLMKNNGVLPLKAGQKIAVVGPNASSVQLGSYALMKPCAVTPVEAITERAEKSGGTVTFAKGCEVFGRDTSDFAEAEDAAKEADAVVCIIGGKSMKGYGIGWGSEEEAILTCGEGLDMHDLTPGGPQLDLIRCMIATGKPVIVVMIDGRPETLFDAADNCDALVAAWYPGEEGSVALAELLYGDCNFSAKLPVTFPRHVGQVPLCHDRVNSACGYYHKPGTPDKPGRDYVFGSTDAAFEFGYGKGYSEIVYHSITAEQTEDEIHICVELENKGSYAADEAVLVFIRDEVASISQPIKKLVCISRVHLNSGEKKTSESDIPLEHLMFTDIQMHKRLEDGWFTIMVGNCETRIFVKI